MSDCCQICCDDEVQVWGVWECLHYVCASCALRVRKAGASKDGSLNKDSCIMCKALSKVLYLTKHPDTVGNRKPALKCPAWPNVLCDTPETIRLIEHLNDAPCKICDESVAGDLASLNAHYTSLHGKTLCGICVANRPQVFLAEHTLYGTDDLRRHESTQEDHPDDERNFLGHPPCKFCNTLHYDNSELFKHVSTEHYSCSICDVASETTHLVAFRDRQALAAHLRKQHHYCEECHNDASVVAHPCSFSFPSQMDLQIHVSTAHKAKGGRGKLQFNPTAAAATTATGRAEADGLYESDPNAPVSVSTGKKVFGIYFCQSLAGARPRVDKVWLIEDKQDRVGGKGADAAPAQQGRGRGRGRGGAHADPAPANPAQAIRVKNAAPAYEVEFASEDLHIGFACAKGTPGLLVAVNHERCDTHITELVYSEARSGDTVERSIKFPQLKKRLRIPSTKSRKRDEDKLAKLRSLADAQGVANNLGEVGASFAPPAVLPGGGQPVKKQAFAPMSDEITEELDTLFSIYGEEAFVKDADNPIWTYRAEAEYQGRPTAVLVRFFYPEAFPSIPPVVEFDTDATCGAASSSAVLPRHLLNGLTQDVLEGYSVDEPQIVYLCLDWVTENIEEQLQIHLQSFYVATPQAGPEEAESGSSGAAGVLQGIEISEGPPVTDRKSKFIAHCAKVSTEEDARKVVAHLRSIKRIAVAAHPAIFAYRISDGSRVREGRDDDGESGAADKLLFFLQRANVLDYIVVVTRYYGGVHLGPDRFKHILNVGKELLQQQGVIPEKK